MNTLLMLNSHQTPWAWELTPRHAETLPAEPVPRWLRVECGSVWLTRTNVDHPDEQADDIWLQEGQSVALPEGSKWVVEGWPRARVSLLQPAPAAVRRARAPWWKLA